MDEIMTVADRVLVFYNGRLVADMPSAELESHHLGKAIAGVA
jgi:ABC-type sugar transport system ATPase subunit